MSDTVQTPAPSGPVGESRLARTSAIVAAGTGASRLTGMVRLIVQGWVIGALSAYNVANTVPNLLFDLLAGGVLTATLVPVFVDNEARGDREATDAVWTVTTVLLIVVTVIGLAMAPLVALIGDTPDDVALYRLFLLLFIPQILFYGLSTLASSVLNARRRFAAAAFAPVVNNIVAIGVLVLAGTRIAGGTSEAELTTLLLDNTGLTLFLGLGATAGIAFQAAALWPAMRRAGIRVHRRFDVHHPAVRSVLRLSGWVFAYVVTNQVAILAFLLLTEAVEPDIGPAAYTVSWLFFQLPYGLLAASIITAAVPDLAAMARRADTSAFADRVLTSARLTVLLTVPAAVAFAVLGRPIIGLLFEHGNFGEPEAALSARMLTALSLGIVFFSLYLLAVRCFYAARDTRRPFWINLVESTLQVAIGVALLPVLGAPGLALGFSIAYILGAGIAFHRLHRNFGGLPWSTHVRPLLAMVAAGALMAAAMIVVTGLVGGDTGVEAVTRIAATLLAGGGVYLGVLAVLRVSDLRSLLGAFRRS